ncbi:MAG: sugar kinase, partial [Alphaproteobacteria bacterium]
MRIACIGECMIELSDAADGVTRRYGGDTLNTAVYASRLGKQHGVSVDYFTALGDDPYSENMIAGWRNEGVGVDHVRRMPGRVPGLYMIKTGDAGERSFYYWRDMAPAKLLFDGPAGQALVTTLASYDWIYFSGITLGILNIEGRLALFETLRRASQNSATIVYDSNYRPRLWEDVDEAIAMNEVALGWTDIAMPSFDDERMLYGDAISKVTAQRIG